MPSPAKLTLDVSAASPSKAVDTLRGSVGGPVHPNPELRSLASLTPDEVSLLLRQLNLETYAKVLRALPMTGADLAESTVDDLQVAGVTFRPHRLRLFAAVEELKRTGVGPELLGSSQAAASEAEAMAATYTRTSTDDECSFNFVLADKLRACEDERLPSLQALRRERPDWVVAHTITRQAACERSLVHEYCVVSHRWESPTEPDTQGEQLKAIKAYLIRNPSIKYLWCDFYCMPQGTRTPPEKLEFDAMLPHVNLLYLGLSVLLLVDLSYLSRFWTQFEAWLSMMSASPEGLVPTPASERRCSIVCLHNAKESSSEMTKMVQQMWGNRTSQQAHDILGRPDITVTNAKDKDVQLPKILKIDAAVRSLNIVYPTSAASSSSTASQQPALTKAPSLKSANATPDGAASATVTRHAKLTIVHGERTSVSDDGRVFKTTDDAVAFSEPPITRGSGVHFIEVLVKEGNGANNVIGLAPSKFQPADYDQAGVFVFAKKEQCGNQTGVRGLLPDHEQFGSSTPVCLADRSMGYSKNDVFVLQVDTETMMLTIHKNGLQACRVGPVPSGWMFVVSKWNLKAHFEIQTADGPPPTPDLTQASATAEGHGTGAHDGQRAFKRGERVRIRNVDVDEAEAMGEDHGGWASSMARDLGKLGTIEEVISRRKIKVRADGSSKAWVWNVRAVESVDGGETAEGGAGAGSVGGEPETGSGFRPGQRVRIRSIGAAEAEDLAKGHGGWNKKMAADLGKTGTVTEAFSDTVVRVDVDGGGSYAWNVETLEALGGTLVDLPPSFKKGEMVRVRKMDLEEAERLAKGHGGWVMSMGLELGEVGEVLKVDGDKDVKVRMRVSSDESWWNPRALDRLSETEIKALPPKLRRFRRGDRVRIRNVSKDEGERLAAGHGGWNGDMAKQLGKEGSVSKVDSDGDVHVKIEGRPMSYCWNPRMLELVEEAAGAAEGTSSSGSGSQFKKGDWVVRGPDWRWEDQDGGEGTIGKVLKTEEEGEGEGWVRVRWPNGVKNRYRDREGARDLKPSALPGAASEGSSFQKGDPVVRGPDWRWDDQDGGEGHVGQVIATEADGEEVDWVRVRWPNGKANLYRDHPGARDLKKSTISKEAPMRGLVGRWYCGEKVKYFDGERRWCRIHRQVAKDGSCNCDGNCGPGNGCQCEECYKRTFSSSETVARRLEKGDWVVRGPDWEWDDQDGGEGSIGKVVKDEADGEEPGWVKVRWPSGEKNCYRDGKDNARDLKLSTQPGTHQHENREDGDSSDSDSDEESDAESDEESAGASSDVDMESGLASCSCNANEDDA